MPTHNMTLKRLMTSLQDVHQTHRVAERLFLHLFLLTDCWGTSCWTKSQWASKNKPTAGVSMPGRPARQSCPAAASYWPVSDGSFSPAAEPPCEEGAAEPETQAFHFELRSCRMVLLPERRCVWPASQFGAWPDRPEGRKAGMGEEREEEGGRKYLIFLVLSVLVLCLSCVLPEKKEI